MEGAVTAHPVGTLRALSVLYNRLTDARAGTGRTLGGTGLVGHSPVHGGTGLQ